MRRTIHTSKCNYTAAVAAAVACLPITSLIVIELRFIALFIISRNHTASLVISIPIRVYIMENNKNIWKDKEDSLFGFTLEDV